MTRRLISFSLYGDAQCYRTGALKNIETAAQLYPGWSCRFYVSQEIPEDVVSKLEVAGAEIVRRRRVRTWRPSADPMLWRFEVAGERGVDAVIVRDADSVPTSRERAAVEAWLESGSRFHLMRDHPFHNQPMLGGMWGCRGGALPDVGRLIRRWEVFFLVSGGWVFHKRAHDQVFLGMMVYPIARSRALIHTSFVRYIGEEAVPFPTERLGEEFVGESFRDDPEGETRMRSALRWATPMTVPTPEYRFIPRVAKKVLSLIRVRGPRFAGEK